MCPGGKCPGGKCPGGKCPRVCPWGRGGVCPRTSHNRWYSSHHPPQSPVPTPLLYTPSKLCFKPSLQGAEGVTRLLVFTPMSQLSAGVSLRLTL